MIYQIMAVVGSASGALEDGEICMVESIVLLAVEIL